MRLRLLQLAVLALLAAVVVASPLERGATIAGIVSSVDPVHLQVRVLDDAVTIDASHATIHDPHGPATFADIHRDAEISAAVHKDPSSGALRALAITILRQAPGKVVGTIEAIDLAAQTLTVLGLHIHVTPDTKFGGYVPTHDPKSLSDLRVSDEVSVQVRHAETGLTAVEVTRIGIEVLPELTFHGQLTAIEGDLYRITLADARVVAVRVTPETHLFGTPAVGNYLIVRAVIQGPDYVALSVTVTEHPPATPFRATGRVLEIHSNLLVIREDSNRELRIIVTPSTVFAGTPHVLDRVVVTGVEEPPGRMVAHHVALESSRPPSGNITISGVIQQMSELMWIVGDWRVRIAPTTVVHGAFGVGDPVRVRGTRQFTSVIVEAEVIERAEEQ